MGRGALSGGPGPRHLRGRAVPQPGSAVGRGPDAVSLAVHGLPRQRHRQSHVRVQSARLLLPALGLRLPVSTQGLSAPLLCASPCREPCPGAPRLVLVSGVAAVAGRAGTAGLGPRAVQVPGGPQPGSRGPCGTPAIWGARWAAAPAYSPPGSVPRAWTRGGSGRGSTRSQSPTSLSLRVPVGTAGFRKVPGVRGGAWGEVGTPAPGRGPHVGLSTSLERKAL